MQDRLPLSSGINRLFCYSTILSFIVIYLVIVNLFVSLFVSVTRDCVRKWVGVLKEVVLGRIKKSIRERAKHGFKVKPL